MRPELHTMALTNTPSLNAQIIYQGKFEGYTVAGVPAVANGNVYKGGAVRSARRTGVKPGRSS
jgi:hypothetical protein